MAHVFWLETECINTFQCDLRCFGTNRKRVWDFQLPLSRHSIVTSLVRALCAEPHFHTHPYFGQNFRVFLWTVVDPRYSLFGIACRERTPQSWNYYFQRISIYHKIRNATTSLTLQRDAGRTDRRLSHGTSALRACVLGAVKWRYKI